MIDQQPNIVVKYICVFMVDDKLKSLSLQELLDYNESLKNNHQVEAYEDVYINGHLTPYMISNYGNMINVTKNKLVEYQHVRDYCVRTIKDPTTNIGKCIRINILVAQHFCPIRYSIENCKNLQVHHIDKNPRNNNYWNLIWVSFEEHYKIHDAETGHKSFLDVKPTLKYTDDQIHKVCELLEKGTSVSIISKFTGVSKDMIYALKTGEFRKDIIAMYNIGISHPHLSDDIIHNICKMISNGYTNVYIADKLGISPKKISEIRSGRSYRRISKDYDFIYTSNLYNK